ncbi:MAG: polyprenyl synthetase family protein [Verrucomicrobiota bacterium]|jgi:geranylgeranyl diphosphate synthase, type II|nr:polyprenyl synthetase family protein [Verrucomicrobiota bacterium]
MATSEQGIHKAPKVLEPEVFDLRKYLDGSRRLVDRALSGFIPEESARPQTIHQAMRYSIFAGGKRMRPALCLAAAEACGAEREPAIPLACAMECIHTYSLIHDDLPSMDNDDLRRGKPTNHKVFGEGVAVLAGDALLTQAFEIAMEWKTTERYAHRDVVLEIAKAAGSRELIAGQVADAEAEGAPITLAQLKYIHECKTASLLSCCVKLGGMSANCTSVHLEALSHFGYHVGMAFQVIDDILDVTQTSEQLGKTAGKDEIAKKATYPALIGLQRSRDEAAKFTQQAFDALAPLEDKAVALQAIAKYLLNRTH